MYGVGSMIGTWPFLSKAVRSIARVSDFTEANLPDQVRSLLVPSPISMEGVWECLLVVSDIVWPLCLSAVLNVPSTGLFIVVGMVIVSTANVIPQLVGGR